MSDNALNICGLTADEVHASAKQRLAKGHGRARAIYRAAMRDGRFDPAAHDLGPQQVAAFTTAFSYQLPRVVRVVEEPFPSEVAGESTAKAVLAVGGGLEIECVKIPMGRGRHSLCISSQVGCKMGCSFCETGRMGLLRNLSAADIVGQVLVARHVLGWPVRNIVFMGMGEALDNWENLHQALQVLTDRNGLSFSHERLTVCTVGHAEGISKLAALGWKRLNLSLSLNAANDELRSQLMPVNRRTPLAELQRLLLTYRQRDNFAFGINYCLMPGINDHATAADEVAAFIQPLGRCLVNVIPYNPGSEALCRPPSEDEVDAFLLRLRAAGCAVRKRITKGRSVMAACGQLGNVELRTRR
ncbi:MAG: radical SAM protein [Planctomycetota bacterium]|jgi:23S rRNA (adenine2503-C2)-methyltransferase